jgi:putative aminopeptidase FrvX
MLLEKLSNACGLAGCEDEVRDLLKQELAPYVNAIWSDALGNLIMRKGNGPVSVMIDAHMDEVGFLVGSITDEGYIRLKKVGGLDDRVLPGRPVWITNRRILGVIGAKAFHLITAAERTRVIPFDEMYVDIGCTSRTEVEALGIELGDPAYFATTYEHFSETVVKGKAFDDRAGCAALAEILKQNTYPGLTLYGVFTVQEEVGLRGARAAGYNLHPDIAIALEGTGSATIATVDPKETITNMGEGPAISLIDSSGIPNQRIFEALVSLARANQIPYQFRRMMAGGTDAGAIALQRDGVPVCTISVPCRYIHTSASLLNLDDLQGVIHLLHHFLVSVEKGDFRP